MTMGPASLHSTRSDNGSAEGAPGPQVGGIADKISQSISLGMISVGDRLPPETELAAQFGVAVATLRKALAALRVDDIVETRRGRSGGTFVIRAPYPSDDSLCDLLKHVSITSLRDLADEHAAVAAAAAKLATERTSPGRHTKLAELAFRAREAKTTQLRSFSDSRFHIEIAVLSQSQRLLTAEQRMQTETSPLLWLGRQPRVSPQLAFNEHLEIVMAIEQGRAEDARALAERHVMDNIRSIVETKLLLTKADSPLSDSASTAQEQSDAGGLIL